MRSLVTNRLLLLLALTAAMAAARAQAPFPPPPAPTPSGAYAGGTLGSSQAKKDCVGVLEGGGRSCDERDPAFGVFGGDRRDRQHAAEVRFPGPRHRCASAAAPS